MFYIGLKVVHATPQVKMGIPADKETVEQLGSEEVAMGGYKVVYANNYASWSPKDVFEEAYMPLTDTTNFLLPTCELPHQQRVVDEYAQLLEKQEALLKFLDTEIYAALPDPEKHRLYLQSGVMRMYLEILKERILNF
jgi:hypothetical protein